MLTLISCPGNKNGWKASIVSIYRSVKLEECFSTGAQHLQTPLGKVPVLLVPEEETVLFEAHAIAKCIAKLGQHGVDLLGDTPILQAQVDQWIEFSSCELDAPLLSWYLPLLNIWQHDKRTERAAQDTLRAALRALDAHLQGRQFLVGEYVTLADVVVCCDLFHGYTKLFDEGFRAEFPNVTAHFQHCVGLPEFEAVMGQVELCTQPLRHGGGKRGPLSRHAGAAAGAQAAAEQGAEA